MHVCNLYIYTYIYNDNNDNYYSDINDNDTINDDMTAAPASD